MIDPSDIAVILLAAGRSERFGSDDKLLHPLDGRPLALHAARRIAELAPRYRIAVCRNSAAPLAAMLQQQGFDIVENTVPERGLSYSLALGVTRAEESDAEAALVCLADMPFVGIVHLRALLGHFDPQATPVVASARAGTAMPPALFPRSLFAELAKLEGDVGARALLAGALRVEADPAELHDIDRPGDLPGA